MKKIKVLENRSEIGAGTRGASLGVDAIKVASLDFMSNIFTQHAKKLIKDENHLLYETSKSPFAKRHEGVLRVLENVANAVKETLLNDEFPVVLAGDHSSAAGTIAGIKLAFPQKRLGVIWLDAHADLHSPYTTPSGNMHGMPLAISMALDNKENKKNELDKNTLLVWNKMKNIGDIEPKISPEDVVFIGLRDYEREEEAIIKKHKIKVIPVSEVRKKGSEQIVRQSLLHLQSCDAIYISYDVDCLDSSVSKGTGTPVANGLKEKEIEDILASFMQNHKICCFEITEVNPTLDKENLMAEIAFNVLQRCINIISKN